MAITIQRALQALPPSKLFINGSFVASTSDAQIEVRNPATGELVTTVPDASAADVDSAVAAARASFESKAWRGKDPSEKERILWRLADIMDSHKEELAAFVSLENGKTLREALRADVNPAIDAVRYYAGWVRRIFGETIPVDGPYLNFTMREPVGVDRKSVV